MSHRKPPDDAATAQDTSASLSAGTPRKKNYSRSMHRARSHESAHAEAPLPEATIPQHPLIPRNAAELVDTPDGALSAGGTRCDLAEARIARPCRMESSGVRRDVRCVAICLRSAGAVSSRARRDLARRTGAGDPARADDLA